jgi:hypothetical protein
MTAGQPHVITGKIGMTGAARRAADIVGKNMRGSVQDSADDNGKNHQQSGGTIHGDPSPRDNDRPDGSPDYQRR